MKSLIKKIGTLGASLVPLVTNAQISNLQWGTSKIQNESDILTFITSILNWVFGLLLIVSVAMILYAGFRYITAAGDEGKVKSAKKTLTYALIGIGIALLSKAIVLVIASIVGVSTSTPTTIQ